MEFVSSDPLLSFRLTASLNVSVILVSTATPVCVFSGLHSWVGPVISAVVKLADATLTIAVSHEFSTAADIAT